MLLGVLVSLECAFAREIDDSTAKKNRQPGVGWQFFICVSDG